jgi:GNAT superfamily N-acetyltransferase
MQNFSILAIVFAFFALAFAGSPYPPNRGPPPLILVKCAEYNDQVTKGVKWREEGYLTQNGNDLVPRGMSKYDTLSIHDYDYTIAAGVDTTSGSKVVVQVSLRGKGLGQQLLVTYLDRNKSVLRSYWIWPNQRCTVESPFPASLVDTIKVSSRKN